MIGLLQLVIMIAVCGLIVWAVTELIPMPPQFKKAIYVISIVVLAIYVLQSFGFLTGMPAVRMRYEGT